MMTNVMNYLIEKIIWVESFMKKNTGFETPPQIAHSQFSPKGREKSPKAVFTFFIVLQ